MNKFSHGRPIELVAKVGGTHTDVSVVIESLTSKQEEVEVQLRFFEPSGSGEYRLNLPTEDLPRGEYDIEVAAVRGKKSTTLVKDHFVLS